MYNDTHDLLKELRGVKGQDNYQMSKVAILLVDDSTTNLRVLRATLGSDNYDIVAVDSSQAALDMVRANPGFDLILLDVAMPDLSGIEVCRILKTDPDTRHIPVLLISGLRTSEQSVREGMQAGADGYLMKPLAEDALRASVKAALRVNHVQREARASLRDGSRSAEDILREVSALPQKASDPLQTVWAAADLLAADLPEDSKERRLADDIRAQIDRLARLIAETGAVARERLEK